MKKKLEIQKQKQELLDKQIQQQKVREILMRLVIYTSNMSSVMKNIFIVPGRYYIDSVLELSFLLFSNSFLFLNLKRKTSQLQKKRT